MKLLALKAELLNFSSCSRLDFTSSFLIVGRALARQCNLLVLWELALASISTWFWERD